MRKPGTLFALVRKLLDNAEEIAWNAIEKIQTEDPEVRALLINEIETSTLRCVIEALHSKLNA